MSPSPPDRREDAENNGDDPEEAPITTVSPPCESDESCSDDEIGAASPDTRAGSATYGGWVWVVVVTGLALPTGSPASCPVIPGQETTLEIRKGRSGLGLNVAGGVDTQLVSRLRFDRFSFSLRLRFGRHFDPSLALTLCLSFRIDFGPPF